MRKAFDKARELRDRVQTHKSQLDRRDYRAERERRDRERYERYRRAQREDRVKPRWR